MSAWLAIAEAPEDDVLRQMLADELLARGDPLGELITLASRHAALGPTLELPALERLRQLWKTHAPGLQARFSAGDGRLSFSRGLQSRLRIDAAMWLYQPEVPAPIQRLELDNVTEETLRALLRRPLMQRLTSLVLRAPVERPWSRLFFETLAEHLPPRLRHLGLVSILRPDRSEGVERLADQLASLALGNVLLNWAALAHRPHPKLEELDLDL